MYVCVCVCVKYCGVQQIIEFKKNLKSRKYRQQRDRRRTAKKKKEIDAI